MAPLPYSHAGAKVVFDVAVGIFVLLEWRIRLRSRLDRSGTRPERSSLVVLYVAVAAGAAGGFVLAGTWEGAAIGFARWPLFVVGLAAIVAGIVLRQWAIVALGRLFTTDVRVAAGQPVVDDGPYRWLAHPSYTGLLVSFAGMGLALGNGASLASLTLLPIAGLVVRIRFEERLLLAALGEPYRRFLAGRARLLPGVW